MRNEGYVWGMPENTNPPFPLAASPVLLLPQEDRISPAYCSHLDCVH